MVSKRLWTKRHSKFKRSSQLESEKFTTREPQVSHTRSNRERTIASSRAHDSPRSSNTRTLRRLWYNSIATRSTQPAHERDETTKSTWRGSFPNGSTIRQQSSSWLIVARVDNEYTDNTTKWRSTFDDDDDNQNGKSQCDDNENEVLRKVLVRESTRSSDDKTWYS